MRPAIGALGVVLVVLAEMPEAAAQHAQLSGFAQANYSARVTGADCSGRTACDLPLGEERLQLRLEGFSDDGTAGFAGKIDFYHDAVMDEPGIEVRETYVDLNSEYVTLRAGRQIVTWGAGDLLFINDTFPKDWVAFFTGRPLQYLKVGSDAMKVNLHHADLLDAEIVFAPFFQPDRYPTGERLILPDPFPPSVPRRVEDRERSFENMEIAAKLSRYVSDWEIAAYASRSFYRVPAAEPDDPTAPTEVRYFFPRLNTFGGSVTGSLIGGVLGVEGGYYDSPTDRAGDNAVVENSQVRGLVGYSHPLWEDATLSAQAYVEWMQNHDTYVANVPAGMTAQDEFRWTATMRFTQLLFHQTLTFNFFAFWGVSEEDGYLIPSLRYAFTDALWAETGANIFLANDDHTAFGRLNRNDNVYLTLRYGF